MLKLIILLMLIALSGYGKDIKELDKAIQKYRISYIGENTSFNSKKEINEKEIEKRGQSPKVSINRRLANCVDFSILVKSEAEKLGFKAEYVVENHHITVKVRNGIKSYRYSNGKNTTR